MRSKRGHAVGEVTVLIVDDDALVGRGFRRVLERQGYRVTVATSIKQARSFLKMQHFDVALVDKLFPHEEGEASNDGVDFLKEVTTRFPGRVDAAETRFASATELAKAMRRASVAHGEHEQREGGEYDVGWPDWYAAYIVAEQAGTELPS